MIKLVKEVYTTTTNGYEEKLGEFVLKKDESISVTERNFIKPIPKSTLLFKNFSFFIDRIMGVKIYKRKRFIRTKERVY